MRVKEQISCKIMQSKSAGCVDLTMLMFQGQLIWNLNTPAMNGIAALFQNIKAHARNTTNYVIQEP